MEDEEDEVGSEEEDGRSEGEVPLGIEEASCGLPG